MNILDNNYSNTFVNHLFDHEAIQLQGDVSKFYRWSSGVKSPIYCDNRAILSCSDIRDEVVSVLVGGIVRHCDTFDSVSSVATGGIAIGTLLADRLDLPFSYVRNTAKGHGLGRQIEGRLSENSKVILFEDLISTGESVLESARILEDSGHKVVSIVSLFGYRMSKLQENLRNSKYPVYTLASSNELIEVVEGRSDISDETVNQLKIFFG